MRTSPTGQPTDSAAPGRRRVGWKTLLGIVVAGTAAAILIGALSAPAATAKCLPVGKQLIATMNIDVHATDPANNVVRAAAVPDGERANVYFVAAEISGPGIAHNQVVGVWATNRLDGSGMIFSVDAFAKQFSQVGDGSTIADPVTLDEAGGSDVTACLK